MKVTTPSADVSIVHAKELANFWINHYKMQVEARSCHTDVPGTLKRFLLECY